MNIHSTFILRNDYQKKDGSYPINLRITINRKVKVYSLGISTYPKWWNQYKNLVRAPDPESDQKNKLIQVYKKKAEDIIFHYLVNSKVLTLKEFDRQFRKENFANQSFYEFAEQELALLKNKFSNETSRFYKSQISKLKKFCPEVSFNEIDISFIKEYENYMITKLGNNPNTISKTLRWLKSFLNRAIQSGIIKENIFKVIPISKYEGNREFLTAEEIEKLEILFIQHRFSRH